MRTPLTLVAVLVLALFATACSGDDGDSTTTTTDSGDASATTLATAANDGGTNDTTATDTGSDEGGATTTIAVTGEPNVPEFTIVSREEGEEGDTVVVLLDPASYESLTDIDLLNLLSELVDEFPPVFEAHVIDDEVVAELVLAEEVDRQEQRLLDNHYFVRLDEGFRITYVGVFEESGTDILGS